jgi:hypothetical protein
MNAHTRCRNFKLENHLVQVHVGAERKIFSWQTNDGIHAFHIPGKREREREKEIEREREGDREKAKRDCV